MGRGDAKRRRTLATAVAVGPEANALPHLRRRRIALSIAPRVPTCRPAGHPPWACLFDHTGYNNANQTTSAVEKNSGGTTLAQATFVYDAQSNPVEEDSYTQSGGTATVHYAYSADQLFADLSNTNGLQTRYLGGDGTGAGVDQIFARITTGTAAWLLTDWQGSVRKLTDSTGTLQDTIAYDGFGNITSETSSSAGGAYKYAGYRQDSITGQDQTQARFYDPTTGRWDQQDPAGFAAGDANLYRYVGNDASNMTDPSGLAQVPVNSGGTGGTGMDNGGLMPSGSGDWQAGMDPGFGMSSGQGGTSEVMPYAFAERDANGNWVRRGLPPAQASVYYFELSKGSVEHNSFDELLNDLAIHYASHRPALVLLSGAATAAPSDTAPPPSAPRMTYKGSTNISVEERLQMIDEWYAKWNALRQARLAKDPNTQASPMEEDLADRIRKGWDIQNWAMDAYGRFHPRQKDEIDPPWMPNNVRGKDKPNLPSLIENEVWDYKHLPVAWNDNLNFQQSARLAPGAVASIPFVVLKTGATVALEFAGGEEYLAFVAFARAAKYGLKFVRVGKRIAVLNRFGQPATKAEIEVAFNEFKAPGKLGLEEFHGNWKLGLPSGPQRNATLKQIGDLKSGFLNNQTKPGKIVWKTGEAPVDAAGKRIFGKYNSVDNTIELYKDADLSTLTHELLHYDQAVKGNRLGKPLITNPAQRQVIERDIEWKLRQMGFIPR